MQKCVTWPEEFDRRDKPVSMHFMGSYDEVLKRPAKAVNSRTRRESAELSFLVGEGFQEHKKYFARELIKVGTEMLAGDDGGRYHTEKPKAQQMKIFGRVYGNTKKRKPGD